MPRLLNLCAQAMNVYVDRPLVAVEVEAPDSLKQPVARKCDAGVTGELHQERELSRFEFNVGAVDARFACALVDFEPAKAQHRSGLRNSAATAPQDRLDSHDQLPRRKRLADIPEYPKYNYALTAVDRRGSLPNRRMIFDEPTILPEALRIGARANNQGLATLGDRARVTLSRTHQCAEFAKPSNLWRQLRYEDDVGCFGAQRCVGVLQIEKATRMGGSLIH
jgi:hypothetical protein